MAFSPEEQAILQWANQNGKTGAEAREAILRYRTGTPAAPAPAAPATEPVTPAPAPKPTLLDRFREFMRPTQTTSEIEQERQQTITPEAARDIKTEQAARDSAVPISTDPLAFYNDNEKYFGIPLGELGNLGKKAAKQIAKAAAGSAPAQAAKDAVQQGANAAVEKAKDAIPDGAADAVARAGSEVAERVPRIMRRAKDTVTQAAERQRRINEASPAVKEAIQVDLDDRFINTIEQADAPTLQAYKEMTDIADLATGRSGGTLTLQQRPEIVAGRAAEAQYDLIEKNRKEIGKAIGEAYDKLAATTRVDLTDAFNTIKQTLDINGITEGKEGVLSFVASRFTPAERARIQQLYDLALEGSTQLTPRKVFDKDQLFSKLQREARFEGIGDIIVDTAGGKSSLFRVFRDVYSDALDAVSQDDLRLLKRQYRDVITLIDDIEGSIFKTGNFDTAKNIDAAEFAKTNLRRILSDAQSAPIYQAITQRMDEAARKLGYEGSNPEELIAFATALRDIYAEATPRTSFTGIMGGIKGAIEKAFEVGAPTAVDRQNALKQLIAEALGRSPR